MEEEHIVSADVELMDGRTDPQCIPTQLVSYQNIYMLIFCSLLFLVPTIFTDIDNVEV